MTYYLKGTYLQKKKGKLHIYVRNNKDSKGRLKSKFYVGRTYIQGKSTVKSSGTANKKDAVKFLEKTRITDAIVLWARKWSLRRAGSGETL